MTRKQHQIGQILLKFLVTNGQANTDEYFHHLVEAGFDSTKDQPEIGLVKDHLQRLGLLEPLGTADYFFAATTEGLHAASIGLDKWFKQQTNKNEQAPTMTVKEKKRVVLNALYEKRFDGKLHNIQQVDGLANWNEAWRIAKALQDEGFVKMVSSKDSVHGEITAAGMEWFEQDEPQDKGYRFADRFTDGEIKDMMTRLDKLAEAITRIEVGQQITYDDLMEEFEEMKRLLSVLGKKNWREVLTGKLVDAGFGTIADKVGDVLIDIFKQTRLLGN